MKAELECASNLYKDVNSEINAKNSIFWRSCFKNTVMRSSVLQGISFCTSSTCLICKHEGKNLLILFSKYVFYCLFYFLINSHFGATEADVTTINFNRQGSYILQTFKLLKCLNHHSAHKFRMEFILPKL